MPDASEFVRLWVSMGTSPFNHVLTEEEGTRLAELVTGDVGLDDTIDAEPIALFVEGADIWGIDPATDFDDYDGVESGTPDGDDTFLGMNGLSFGELDLSDLANSKAAPATPPAGSRRYPLIGKTNWAAPI